MRIGIDISQIVYTGTGVARYIMELIPRVIRIGEKHTFVLFGSSLRKKQVFSDFYQSLLLYQDRVKLVVYPLPPTILDILWNRFHIIPVEWLTGPIDIFWSSDWIQPPLSMAKGITTVHDMIVYTNPEESHPGTNYDMQSMNIQANIVATQKRRLSWVDRECQQILCDSEATKVDIVKYLGINKVKLSVVYPGVA